MHKNVITSGVATAGVALGIGAAALAFGTGTAAGAPTDSGSSASESADDSSDRDDSATSTERDSTDSSSEGAVEDRDVDTEIDDESDTEGDADDEAAESIASEDDALDDIAEDEVVDEDVSGGGEQSQDDAGEDIADVDEAKHDVPVSGDSDDVEEVAEPAATTEVFVAQTNSDREVPARVVPVFAPDAPVLPAPGLPDVPPATPLEFLNWVGSQIQRTFFNRTPTLSPVQLVQTDAAQIVGSVRATDFEGDRLVYKLVQGPTRGTLVFHDDGSYTYTPNASLIGEGGADSFTVKVRDIGPHLHLFNGTGTAASTVVLSVRSDSDVEAPQTSTRGFNVYNLSGENMVFKGYTKGGNRVDSGPAVGAVYAPGTNAHIEVVFRFLDDDEVYAEFETATHGTVTVGMLVQSLDGDAWAACSGMYCTPNTDDYQETQTVIILDAPGTVIEVPSGQSQRQVDLLNTLCSDGGQAICNFDVGRQEQWFTEGEQASSTFYNDSDATQSISKGASKTEGYSDSLGGNAKFGFKLTEAINFEIQATYNHTWTTSETWSETVTLEVPPWTEASIYASAPMNRVYGDLTIEAGNTKWILRDVYFDSPDDTGHAVFRPHYVPIPHEDVAAIDL